MNDYDGIEARLLRARGDVVQKGAREPHLVSCAWLAEHVDLPGLRVFEVSVAVAEGEGRIPGAVALDWETDLLDQVRRDVVERARLEQTLQSAGVDTDTTLVLYGDCHNWFAAFAAWVLALHGVPDVRLLDGGRAKWLAEGRPLSTGFPHLPEGTIRLAEGARLRARLAEVVAVAEGEADAVLLDVRSPDEFAGLRTTPDDAPESAAEGALRAGHIPGAVNLPWGRLVDADGTFRPEDELRRILAEHGIDGSREIITYCRIGERSGHTWFALSRLLGWRVRNYDGSWAEYGNAVGVPITNPAA
jgi:thiosulfate/3-mercaptopyruvate sulfurtransferase